MTDMEMLELAAKAARYTIRVDVVEGGVLFQKDSDDGGSDYSWNPIKDDGDAFRLAIALGISICFSTGFVEVGNRDGTIWMTLPIRATDDVDKLAKRMIVQVAAEIGKGMRVIPEISQDRKHMHEVMVSSPCSSLNSLVEKYREFKHLDEKREKFYIAVLNGTPPSLDNYPE